MNNVIGNLRQSVPYFNEILESVPNGDSLTARNYTARFAKTNVNASEMFPFPETIATLMAIPHAISL